MGKWPFSLKPYLDGNTRDKGCVWCSGLVSTLYGPDEGGMNYGESWLDSSKLWMADIIVEEYHFQMID
jgi:hypothetical protein